MAVVLLISSAVLALIFVYHERQSVDPVMHLDLLRLPGVRIGNLALFLNAGGLAATLFFVTLYLQNVLDHSPLAVAGVFAPVTLLILILSPRAASLTGNFGVRTVLTPGLAVLAVGMLLLARVPVDGGLVDVLPGMFLLAVGSSFAYAPTFIAASTGVPDGDQGAASGLINSMQELGAAACLGLLAYIASTATADTTTLEELTDGYRAGLLGAAVLLTLATLIACSTPRTLGRAPAASTPLDSWIRPRR